MTNQSLPEMEAAGTFDALHDSDKRPNGGGVGKSWGRDLEAQPAGGYSPNEEAGGFPGQYFQLIDGEWRGL